MPKVKTNEPPKLPANSLPLWVMQVRRKYTKLTCPREGCKQSFYVRSVPWLKRRREGWTSSAPCPFCFRSSKLPPLEEE